MSPTPRDQFLEVLNVLAYLIWGKKILGAVQEGPLKMLDFYEPLTRDRSKAR